MPVNESTVLEVLNGIEDPEFRRNIADLGLVRGVSIDGGHVEIALDLVVDDHPGSNHLQEVIVDAVSAIDGVAVVTFDLGVMNELQRAAVRELLIGDPSSTAGSQPSMGHAEGREIPFSSSTNRTRSLLIASGKGGVGKSSITTNLAIALANTGASVAVVDADVWGFSVPRMLGIDRSPTVVDDMIIPPQAHGVRCISMGFFAREDQPIVWRGPMLHKALEQFLTDVFWDDPDYLLIDLPPGTRRYRSVSRTVPAASRGLRGDHTQPRGPDCCPACGVHVRTDQDRRQGRHREHGLVHRRRRQAVSPFRQWWGSGHSLRGSTWK